MYEESVDIVAATTAYGRPGIDLLARQVAELKDGDPLSPVTVVVATNHAAVAARRALAGRDAARGGNGVVNVTFLTLHRLAERLGGPALAAAGRRPVAVPVIAAAVRAVLADEPGVFAPVAEHPATEQALVAAHRELSDATANALDAVAAASDRARDVIRIHRAVGRRLRDTWFDEADLLASAADRVRADPATVRNELGPVVLHHLRHLTTAAAAFIGTLASATTVRVDVALTGDPAADRAVIAAHERAGITIDTTATLDPPVATGIISASDPDDEVRAAIRRLVAWIHDGVPLGRTALLYGSADPYARLLHEQLAAAAIPFNGAPVRAIGDLFLGRTLRHLLALRDRNYRRPDVFAVVHSRRWETISRNAGVVDGTDWDTRLTRFADDERALAAEIVQDRDRDPDENERRAARHRRNADEADALRDFVARLRAHLDRAAGDAGTTWADLVAWAHELIDTYIGDPGRRQSWPDEEQEAAHRVEAAIDALAGLDVLADGAPPTLDVFRRTLEGELESSLRRQGRLGDGVLVGPVSIAPGLVLDRVVVLGMAEGAFPPRRLEDSLLPDRERERAAGELQLRAHRVDDDRRNLLAAVAAVGSGGEAVLAHPRGDLRRNGERPASRWLLADAARLAGCDTLRAADLSGYAGAAWMEYVASFTAGAARATAHTTAQSLRLAAIARGEYERSPLLDDDRPLAIARTVVRARRSSDFTRFDGNLREVAEYLRDLGTMSASRLQTWAACPHAYLLQHVLGVEPLSEPERRIAIDPLDVGTLVHAILDEFVDAAIRDRAGEPIRHWGPADRARLHLIAETRFADAQARGVTGKALLWERDRARISNDLDRFVDEDNIRLAADGVAPAATELEFGDVTVTLPSGRALHVRGSIDRVDAAPDGSLVVLDYKTGRPDRYRGLGEEDPHKGGTLLQLYLYAAAARDRLGTDTTPVWAGYWFTTTKRGGFERIGYQVTPAVEAEVGRAIDVIVDGITSGVFPARPAEKPAFTHVDCWYCTPDGLNGTERRRDWDRKRAAPELLAYAALSEPVDG